MTVFVNVKRDLPVINQGYLEQENNFSGLVVNENDDGDDGVELDMNGWEHYNRGLLRC